MKLGILLCDHVSESLSKDHGQYPGMIEALFGPVTSSLSYKIYDVAKGDLPKEVNEVDAYITSGSRFGVYDNVAWIRSFESFVQTLYAAQKKLIGICFGHQMIAQALGGKVMKSSKGWGVGVAQNTVFEDTAWMNPNRDSFNILVSHQDQVVELPPDGKVVAGSDFCPNFMMQVGEHFLGIQGHPEFTKAYTKDLLLMDEKDVGEDVFQNALSSFECEVDKTLMANWMLQFLGMKSQTMQSA